MGRGVATDWAMVGMVFVTSVVLNVLVEPRVMPVDLSSEWVSHRLLPEFLSRPSEVFGAVLFPALGYFLTEGWAGLHSRAFHYYMLGIIEAGVATIFISDVLQIVAGRPRPYFATVCVSYPEDDLTKTQCTGDPRAVKEARKSFPSDQSALAFSVATFWTLFWIRRSQMVSKFPRLAMVGGPMVSDNPVRDATAQFWRLLVTLVPLLGASLVAVSRVVDYHNNWDDAIAGAALGVFVGALGYTNRERTLSYALAITKPPPSTRTFDVNEETAELVES
mmetsp:Transcript_11700/g.23820  ORF Transcript_11700/g.23820 Transcript_11700/m.23820 type:complete len:277 (-) Transcript_11700:319-1149(-)|eukprot:CAMPEP_0184679914 /NCGR_PEP_ID=MMETSP0312-20130426/2788_1 /TAXON_ID=31354 /ORGANISM="Compsopogon coeruleus, Strain SAG 36.94" /LENGTH=276 /DNA_ID=CAMNT_0027129677 /DNA_START=469 /DNA_END=1299 /DNA_ORIENTATION=-